MEFQCSKNLDDSLAAGLAFICSSIVTNYIPEFTHELNVNRAPCIVKTLRTLNLRRVELGWDDKGNSLSTGILGHLVDGFHDHIWMGMVEFMHGVLHIL